MRKLLKALWPRASMRGAITLWTSPSKTSIHFPLDAVAQLEDGDIADLTELVGDCNVYFGLGLRVEGLPEHKQGGKKDIIALPGMAVDLDFYDPKAHVATNLPRDLDEAAPLIDHLPDPSAIVGTGNGAHPWWFLHEPLILDTPSRRTQAQRAYKAVHEKIIARAAERGWHLDDTASIQRVWRVPGFVNQKTGNPVELLYCDESLRYHPHELGIKMPKPRKEAENLASPSVPEVSTPAKAPPTKTPDDVVEKIRNGLKRVSPNNRFYGAIQAALKGESMANAGERDITLQGVCSTIAWLPDGRAADPEKLAEVLRASLEVWVAEEGATKSIDDELEKAVDKIKRNQEDYWNKQAKQRPQLAGIAKALGVDLDDGDDEDFILQHALLQFRSTYYAFDFRSDRYTKPKTKEELRPLLRDAWSVGPNGLSIRYVNDKGQTKSKTLDAIREEYCTNLNEAVGDMTIDDSFFKRAEGVFYEAMAQKRVTEARFDPLIDEWLRLLVGNSVTKDGRKVIDLLLDWIAAVPMLAEQNSALYLDGFSGAGKGLLANGLARLYREGAPSSFLQVIDKFNDDLVKCPLVWIDEGVPGRSGNITAELRALVGRSSFTLNEKYLSTRTVRGCIRLMICANNENVLMLGNTEMSTKDLEAIVGRILHIHAQPEAAKFLSEKNKDGKLTRAWVEGDRIAQHCLYLHETRQIKRGKRFLVEGDETTMHRKLVMQGDINSLVYEWIVRFATTPDQVAKAYKGKGQKPMARIGSGEILINTQCVIDCWKTYMPDDTQRPQSNRIGGVLNQLAHRQTKLGSRGSRTQFHVLKADLALEWCRQQQIGNEDKIVKNLKRAKDW